MQFVLAQVAPRSDILTCSWHCSKYMVYLLGFIAGAIGLGIILGFALVVKIWKPEDTAGHKGLVIPVLYDCLSFVGLMFFTTYSYVQFDADMIDEGMAAVVSGTVAIYGGYLYMRQRAVLSVFEETLQKTAKIIRVLGVPRDCLRDISHGTLK